MNLKKSDITIFNVIFVYVPLGWIFGSFTWGVLIRNYGFYFVGEYLSLLAMYYLLMSIYTTLKNSFSSSKKINNVEE